MQRGWGYLRGEFGEFIDVVPAQQQTRRALVPGHGRRASTRTSTRREAPAEARAGPGRRPHLQDGLRPDDRLPRGEGRRHHRRRRRGAAGSRARVRRDVGRRVEPRDRLRREAGRSREPMPGDPTSRWPRWASTSSTPLPARAAAAGATPTTRHQCTTSARTSFPGDRQAAGLCLSVPRRAHAGAELLARRGHGGCVSTRPISSWCTCRRNSTSTTRSGRSGPTRCSSRRRNSCWTNRTPRHGDQLAGRRRFDHLRRGGARFAAVLAGARRGTLADRAFGDHAGRAHRQGLPHPPAPSSTSTATCRMARRSASTRGRPRALRCHRGGVVLVTPETLRALNRPASA